MTTTTDKPAQEFKVIGTRPVRHDGIDKVLGRAQYGADVKLPGLIHGAVLRSPYAHAIIKKVDVSRAEAAPGVFAAITGEDMPVTGSKLVDMMEEVTNLKWASQRVMAHDKTVYRGHPVAAVAAVDQNTALEALKLIEVEYEPLPAVISLEDAMKPDAVIIHDDLEGNHLGEKVSPTNIAEHTRTEFGDPDAAFAEAAHVLERTYTIARAHQGYIEPHSSTAFWSPDDKLAVWTTTPGAVRRAEQSGHGVEAPALQRARCADGDRRRVRRQDRALPGALGRDAVPQVRQAGQDDHGPQVRVRRHRPRPGRAGHRKDRSRRGR